MKYTALFEAKGCTRNLFVQQSRFPHSCVTSLPPPYWLLAYRLTNDPRLVPRAFRQAKNILFVTAHPDDESLFFSPSVLYRSDDPAVTRGLLVLSAGMYNAQRHTIGQYGESLTAGVEY